MTKFYCGLAVALGMTLGCASTPAAKSGPIADGATINSPGDEPGSSQVLSQKKCPKNSKLVDGKCTMSVESDE